MSKRRISPVERGKKTKILRCSCGNPEEFLVTDSVAEVKCVYCLFRYRWDESAKNMRANQRFKFEALDKFWCRRKRKCVIKMVEDCKRCKWFDICSEIAKNKTWQGSKNGD